MIWGPFVLAVVLGLIVSAGLYFAYLWPQVEPADDADDDDDAVAVADAPAEAPAPAAAEPGP